MCGCDGKTHDNDCKAWAAGVNIASKGPCNYSAKCSNIALAYINVIKTAKVCTVGGGPNASSCTKKVDDKIACPCPTFVNPKNTTALSPLTSLRTAWKANKCDANRGACPPVPCKVPKSATCKGSGTGSKQGRCEDQFK